MLYTALSRTCKLEFSHLNFKNLTTKYKYRSQPIIELVNSKFNSLYKNGKIYEVVFNNGKIYVGYTCDEIEKRLEQHKKDEKSQVYKNKKYNPVIKLIINAPSKDKKALENVEKKYIKYYAETYGSKLINKKCNPNGKKKKESKKDCDIEYQVDTEKEFRERIRQLEDKIEIKDNEERKYFYYEVQIKGERKRSKVRQNKIGKKRCIKKIQNNKDSKIKELTLNFD